jgi:hypothetical protein
MDHRLEQLEVRLQAAGADFLEHEADGVEDGGQGLVLVADDAKASIGVLLSGGQQFLVLAAEAEIALDHAGVVAQGVGSPCILMPPFSST